MSRIHEALRKVADLEGQTVRIEPADPVERAADSSESSPEAFPIEPGDRQRPQPAVRPSPEPPAAATPVTAEVPERRESGAGQTEPIAFERIDARYAGKIVVDQEMSAASREQYRKLAATLHHAQAASGLKVVMVTSAVMGEGKTLTSSNLALTLSESYHKQVLLLDADLRRPALHTVFRIRGGTGLSEGLMHTTDRKVPVHQVSNRLGILAAGQPTSDPIAGLTSARMRRLLEEARSAFDWVVLDTPPVALLPDAHLLASMVDGALVVVRAGSTPWDLVQRAVDTVGRDRILGVVLNGATDPHGAVDYYGYYYYAKSPAGAEVRSSI